MNSFRLRTYIHIINYVYSYNFGSFYFLPISDIYNIIEHTMSVIGPKRIVKNYFKIKV